MTASGYHTWFVCTKLDDLCIIYTVSCIMMLECFFASESVSSSDALKFGLFFMNPVM